MSPRPATTRAAAAAALVSSLASICLSLIGPAPALAQNTDYVARLNGTMSEITDANRSYRLFFDAWKDLDSSDLRIGSAKSQLTPGTGAFDEATTWAGEDAQQTAVKILLTPDSSGRDATQRKIFGLPYGQRDVDANLAAYDFAVYFEDDLLAESDFAYLPAVEDLWALLHAEAYRRAADGDPSGGSKSLLAMTRLARQICDRQFFFEKRAGISHLAFCCESIRRFMWFYRDGLSVDDYHRIAGDLEALHIIQLEPPQAERFMGEQLVERIFGPDFRPSPDSFASTVARAETYHNPLKRFESAARWNQVLQYHMGRVETLEQINVVAGDYARRWRLPLHDPQLSATNPAIESVPRVTGELIHTVLGDVQKLFDDRLYLLEQVNGTATSAGIMAYIKRERGALTPGVADGPSSRIYAPVRLAQVQPAFVTAESALADPYDRAGGKLRYSVIHRRTEDRALPTYSYTITTDNGVIQLPEGWPLLYSIGTDTSDGGGSMHKSRADLDDKPDGDVIFWPPVELLAGSGG